MVAAVFGQGLSHRVSVYVPSTVDVNESLSKRTAELYACRVQRQMARRFGGSTAIAASGGWFSESGYFVTEQVTIVYAFSENLATGDLVEVKSVDGQTLAHVQIVSIMMVEPGRLGEGDFRDLGYPSRQAYMADWGEVMGDRVWIYRISYLSESELPS